DTLADAVRGASGGDTIEVRGNGPFVTPPISINGTALTIRAGAGFRPVIKMSPEVVPQKGQALLWTNAPLVLEGLEIHRAPPDAPPGPGVQVSDAPLRAAQCRFRAGVWTNFSPVCKFRNCEFLVAGGTSGGQHRSGARVSLENCILW